MSENQSSSDAIGLVPGNSMVSLLSAISHDPRSNAMAGLAWISG